MFQKFVSRILDLWQERRLARLEKEIGEWFNRKYSIGSWQDETFHCYSGAPVELRMFPACNTLEYNISNGGWSQVLWNCFGSWRTLLDIAQEGYLQIAAHDYAEAIDELRALCMKHENECEEFMNAEQWLFGEFTLRSLETMPDCQYIFWNQKEYASLEPAYQIRGRWALANQRTLRSLMNS